MAQIIGKTNVADETLLEPASENEDVWVSVARHYHEMLPPLAPHAEDIAEFERTVAIFSGLGERSAIEAVMLGITPSIALMNWPSASQITGIEMSAAVIKAIWPGDIPNKREAKCASWFALSDCKNSCDVVIGDGSFIACRFPQEARMLIKAVRESLRHGGIFIVRVYIRPDKPESLEGVMRDLLTLKYHGIDGFKLRLWLALARSVEDGVAVQEAARVLEEYRVDEKVMMERLGWTAAAVKHLGKWRTSNAVYSFPSLNELRELTNEYFYEESITFPTYCLGNCCPILVLRTK
jgi:hypothetical protein